MKEKRQSLLHPYHRMRSDKNRKLYAEYLKRRDTNIEAWFQSFIHKNISDNGTCIYNNQGNVNVTLANEKDTVKKFN